MELKVNTRYSKSDVFDYETRLERINIDQERHDDVLSGNGFIINSPKAIKYDLKDPNGIFSTRYGPTLQDMDEGSDRYRCDCGHMRARFNQGETCPVCGTKVTFKGDNFDMFGYPVLKDPYHIIHPNLYMAIAFFIGEKDFKNIITAVNKKDEDGHEVEIKKPKDEPFFGLGMLDFYDKFDEIMDYYLAKKPAKKDYYDSIMADRDKVFIQSIPVFTIHLRPYRLDGGTLHYEGTNAIYNIMVKLIATINDDATRMNRQKKPKDSLLLDLQMKYMELYSEITKIISGKKGSIRQLFGGRYNFTARSVIAPDPSKRIDEVSLSYPCLCGLLQMTIINILQKSYFMRYNDAYKLLHESMHEPNDIIVNIIHGIIKSYDRGIPILINRNPTISLGGILQMYCTDISVGYTMGIPLEVLNGLAADFDGDTLTYLGLRSGDIAPKSSRIAGMC